MTNAQTTRAFLAATDEATRRDVLANIAQHYEITSDEALEEITDDEAESLRVYLTGPTRASVSVLMQRRGFSVLVPA